MTSCCRPDRDPQRCEGTTLHTVVDFDARDKIAASKPIAVTRSAWSDGSPTLFAAADEVYPTTDWGTDYRLPVGEMPT